MKALSILILCLALSACASQTSQVSTLDSRVEVPSQPTSMVTKELPVHQQPENRAAGLPSSTPDSPCSTAETKFLAPMVLEESNRPHEMQLTLVDLANGLPSCGYNPLPLERNNQLAISPDGNHLAVITTESDTFYAGKLLFVDFAHQKIYPTSVKVASWASDIVFSMDGKRLALAYPKETAGPTKAGETIFTLLVVHFGSQGKVLETTLPFGVRLVRFTRDGSALVVYGMPDESPDGDFPTASVALLDASDLSMIWEQRLGQVKHGAIPKEGSIGDEHLMEFLEPAVVFSTQKNSLYIVHADQEKLTKIDFDAHQTSTLDIRPKMSWIERLLAIFAQPVQAKAASGTRKQAVLSPDGKIYVVASRQAIETDKNGNLHPTRELLGLQVLDPVAGEELSHLNIGADEIHISPDGASLFLTSWGWGDVKGRAEVVSIKDMSVRARFDNQSDRTFLITLSPVGKPHLLLLRYGSNNTELTLLDWDSLDAAGDWKVKNFPYLVSMP